MSFARRKQPESAVLPKRTASLRVNGPLPAQSRTVSASCNPHQVRLAHLAARNGQFKDEPGLDAITESNPRKGSVVPIWKNVNPPVVPQKKSVASLRSVTSKESLRGSSTGRPRDSSTASRESSRDTRPRMRPISVTGIPSPSPTRTNSLHARTEKSTAAKADEKHPFRRSVSVRSTSASIEAKSESKSSRPAVPVRDASKPAPPKAQRQKPSKDLSPSPHPQTPSRRPSMLSRDPPPPAIHKSIKPLSTKLSSLSLKSQPPSPTSKPKSTQVQPIETSPHQLRLLQLLHLLPQSSLNLSSYEASAHKTLAKRYDALQSRFNRIQNQDRANSLLETLSTLQSWSDTHIRTLSTLITDWEDITSDIRNYCTKLAVLKPVNNPVLQEKGTPRTNNSS